MRVRVHVFLKDSVFDPQGNTVAGSLKRLGFSKVRDIRMGKVIDIDVETQLEDEAKREAKKMCEKLLVNAVIESYRLEMLKT